MQKTLGFVCNHCKTPLYKSGECVCKKIALLKTSDNRFHLYIDTEEDYDIVYIYINNGRVIKIEDTLFKTIGRNVEYDGDFIGESSD